VEAIMQSLIADFRYGARTLRANSAFTAAAAVALSFGIGANIVIFSMINAILLRPLPHREAARLVFVHEKPPDGWAGGVSAATFRDWQEQNTVFECMAVVQGTRMNLTGRDEPERLRVGSVSSGFFPVLGVQPSQGRLFVPADERPGAAAAAVLSHGLWQRRFGGEDSAVGARVTLDGRPFVVVGVLPSGFRYHTNFEVYVPLDAAVYTQPRSERTLTVIARLKQGVSLAQSSAWMDRVSGNLAHDHPDTNKGWGAIVSGMQEELVRGPRQDLPVLLTAALFLLLIACANVANLLMARAAARSREIALRAALGASRLRLLRQLLCESTLLALLAGTLGVVMSVWALGLLEKMIAPDVLPVDLVLKPDLKVLGFALAVTLLTGLMLGSAPAWRGVRVDLRQALSQDARGAAGGMTLSRTRRILIAAEIALSLVLLVGAVLMIRTYRNIVRLEAGVPLENLLTLQLTLPDYRYESHEYADLFVRQVLQRVESLPGVRSAALTNAIPYGGWVSTRSFDIPGQTIGEQSGTVSAHFVAVSEHFFPTVGIALKKGRSFTERDDGKSARVAIVNEAFVRRFLADSDPLGRQLRPRESVHDTRVLEIVGVSGDIRAGMTPNAVPPQIYVPFLQNPEQDRFLIVQSSARAVSVAEAVRSAVRDLDKDLPLSDIRTMAQVRDRALSVPRVLVILVGSIGGLAMGLAGIGIYGILAYTAAQRRHEMGVRLALGATRGDLLQLVMKQGAAVVGTGMAAGLAGALAVARLMQGIIFGVPAYDPSTYAAVSLFVALVSLVALYLPARRAAATNPIQTLRCQ
jgi:putative ABC transport system permease protein